MCVCRAVQSSGAEEFHFVTGTRGPVEEGPRNAEPSTAESRARSFRPEYQGGYQIWRRTQDSHRQASSRHQRLVQDPLQRNRQAPQGSFS